MIGPMVEIVSIQRPPEEPAEPPAPASLNSRGHLPTVVSRSCRKSMALAERASSSPADECCHRRAKDSNSRRPFEKHRVAILVGHVGVRVQFLLDASKRLIVGEGTQQLVVTRPWLVRS